jgi:hypothetical protein
MIDFDLNGSKVAIDETAVRRLRANAKSAAGSSSTLNDLAVILERALTERKPVTLRRAEARALQRLIDQDGSAPARPYAEPSPAVAHDHHSSDPVSQPGEHVYGVPVWGEDGVEDLDDAAALGDPGEALVEGQAGQLEGR